MTAFSSIVCRRRPCILQNLRNCCPPPPPPSSYVSKWHSHLCLRFGVGLARGDLVVDGGARGCFFGRGSGRGGLEMKTSSYNGGVLCLASITLYHGMWGYNNNVMFI